MKLTRGALISPGEVATDRAIRRFFKGKPYLVYKECQLRQVIALTHDELSAGERDYYTKAAFDFIVCNRDQHQSWEIAIEFDGKQHRLAKQARKDTLKDRLCSEAGLPLLRVEVDYVEPRESLTLLEYMLDLYFGEKTMEELKARGEVSAEEEYFIGTGFPAADQVGMRLIQKGVVPAVVMIFVENRYGMDEAKKVLWFRISDKGLAIAPDKRASRQSWKASVKMEVLRGNESDAPLLTVVKEVRLKECSPNRNILGIHTWHLAQELATYFAMVELEKLVDKVGKRLRIEGRIQ